jgi:hypothetical protein
VSELHVGLLDAGRYTTTEFRPTIEFAVGDGWSELFADDDDEVALDHVTRTGFMVTRVTQVVDPETRTTVDVPDDLVAWLAHHPVFKATKPTPVMVAGIRAQMVTLTSPATTDLFAYPTGNMRLPEGASARYFVVPMDGPDLTIIVAGDTKTFDAALALGEPVVASLRITGGR